MKDEVTIAFDGKDGWCYVFTKPVDSARGAEGLAAFRALLDEIAKKPELVSAL